MSSSIGAVVSISVLALLMILGYQYSMQSVASTDMGVDLAGTQYQDAYNSSVNTSRVAYSFMAFLPQFLAVLAIIAVLMLMLVFASRR